MSYAVTMGNLMQKLRINPRVLCLLSLLVCACSNPPVDPALSILVEHDTHFSKSDGSPRPKVILENSIHRAVIATQQGGTCGIESGILEWLHKRTGSNQVNRVIDANYMRGPVISARITDNRKDFKRVLLHFEDLPDKDPQTSETDNSGSLAYTIFSHSPVLKIEYIDRLPNPDPIVDLGMPGGVKKIGSGFSDAAETRVYGQENFNDLVCHPATYWTNVADDPRLQWESGPADGGALNYHNHLIVAVASKASDEGYGRVVPIHQDNERGGARHLKLLWNTGIEFYTKPWTDREFGQSSEQQFYAPPFVAYLFCFTNGLDEAIKLGKIIVDGELQHAKK